MTWSSPMPAAEVRAIAPTACAAFEAIFSALSTVPDLSIAELARRRITTILGLHDDLGAPLIELPVEQLAELTSWPTSLAFSDTERTCLSFAEQFTLDVTAVSDADLARLGHATGAGTFSYVQALYVIDQGLRLRAVTRQLFGSSPWRADPPVSPTELWSALQAMMTAVVRLDALDPLTSELVRLRGARAHNCRVCQSRRHAPVVAQHGRAILDRVDDIDGGEFSPAQQAALRLTDAVLWQPARVPVDVVDEVRAAFEPQAAFEIVLDVVRNASNKIAVALGADAATVSVGVEFFDVDATGAYRYGLDPPENSQSA